MKKGGCVVEMHVVKRGGCVVAGSAVGVGRCVVGMCVARMDVAGEVVAQSLHSRAFLHKLLPVSIILALPSSRISHGMHMIYKYMISRLGGATKSRMVLVVLFSPCKTLKFDLERLGDSIPNYKQIK